MDIKLDSITKIFQAKDKAETVAVKDLDIVIPSGKLVGLLGPSGCGKSTTLYMIAGLLEPNGGRIYFGDEDVTDMAPEDRGIGLVFQNYALFPHLNVFENIAFGLRISKKTEVEINELVSYALKLVKLVGFEKRSVKKMSGGQQQRVAIARALAKEPELLLLDEPFGQIDNFKKNTLRRNLFGYLKEKNISCIIATHDKNDALSFADKLIIIKNNKMVANDSPRAIYKNPKEKYIAALFDDVNELTLNNESILLYPDQLKITDQSAMIATVLKSYFKGSYWLIEAMFNDQKVFVNHFKELKTRTKIHLKISKDS